jgi:polyhydroxybutyrate depolymerase
MTLALLAIILAGVPIFYAIPLVRCAAADAGPLVPGSSYRRLVSAGHKRCYLLYVPSSYREGEPSPIVFSLHGFMSDPYDQRHYARWEAYAEAGGFLVVYPQGSSYPLRWNVGPGARIDDVDDARFIEDVIDEVSSMATVDPRRIFVTGFSNGGEKTNQVGCVLADRVAAIGVVAGLGPDYPGGCHPVRPLPVVAFFGTRETYGQPLPNGLSLWLQDFVFNVSLESILPGPANPEEWIRGWAARNGCRGEPSVTTVSLHVVASTYAECLGNARVILYMVEGGGHAWPGGPSVVIPGFGESTSEIDATQIMWEFFQAHPMGLIP